MTQQSILRLPDVMKRTGLSRSSIYNAIKAGTFPQSVSLGARAVGWFSNLVDEWIAARTSNAMQTVASNSPTCIVKRRSR
ncbi:helix-turn-helix transcriptional regulator [Undibacterium sp. Tian12W]|uniref:helix-turn-helix transcriptional regulator n=1 Tax=Undibacterium sp. Tian12W TaxID=3413054 RepID=UPI003BF0ADFB